MPAACSPAGPDRPVPSRTASGVEQHLDVLVAPGAQRLKELLGLLERADTGDELVDGDPAGAEQLDRGLELGAPVDQRAAEVDFLRDERERGQVERLERDSDEHDAPERPDELE